MQPHVLVVEDEDALSELLSYNLKKEGFRVSLAADGQAHGAGCTICFC